jgi:hypothetical protein
MAHASKTAVPSKRVAPTKQAAPAVDLESLLPVLRQALETRRALKVADLGRLGVPSVQRAEAFGRLASSGAELTKNGARWPLRRQLLELVEQRRTVPLGSLQKLLAGANAREAKSMAEALVREGALRWVVRGKAEVLTTRSARVLDPAALGALGRAAKAVAQQAEKALKSRTVPKSLFRDDVRELLLEHIVEPREAAKNLVARSHEADLGARLIQAVHRALRPELGLAYVPDLVRLLVPGHSVQEIHTALLQAAKGGGLELRPESGLHRLSGEDLALCPQGPLGTRLSWARPLEEARP